MKRAYDHTGFDTSVVEIWCKQNAMLEVNKILCGLASLNMSLMYDILRNASPATAQTQSLEKAFFR